MPADVDREVLSHTEQPRQGPPHAVGVLRIVADGRRRPHAEPLPILGGRQRRGGRDAQRHPALRLRKLAGDPAGPRAGPVRRIEHSDARPSGDGGDLAERQPHQGRGPAGIAGGCPVRAVIQQSQGDSLALPHRIELRHHPRRQNQRGHAPEYATAHRRFGTTAAHRGSAPDPGPPNGGAGSGALVTSGGGCGGSAVARSPRGMPHRWRDRKRNCCLQSRHRRGLATHVRPTAELSHRWLIERGAWLVRCGAPEQGG